MLKRKKSKKVKVISGWYTKEAMKTDLKFKKPLSGNVKPASSIYTSFVCHPPFLPRSRIDGVVRYCSHPSRKKTHIRWVMYCTSCKVWLIDWGVHANCQEGQV